MKRISLLVLLAACAAPAPAPAPILDGTRFHLSREFVQKGIRHDRNPAVYKRDYTLTCTKGPDAKARAEAALAQITADNGRIQPAIGMSISEHGEITRSNPVISAAEGCQITGVQTSLVTNDMAAVMAYVLKNNLIAELAASR